MKYRKLKAGEAFKPGDQQFCLDEKWRPVPRWMVELKIELLAGHEMCYRRPLKPKNKKT